MTNINKVILTLVALLAMTTGAWADDWTNIVKNSDMEGTDVSCFYVKENAKGAENVFIAHITEGIGKDGSRAIKVKTDCNEANDWDTQFFIRLPYELPAGTKYRISFDYKASNGDNEIAGFQCANEPGEYIIWYIDASKIGYTFTTDWQHFSQEFTIPTECDGSDSGSGYLKNCQTFASSLGKLNGAATEYIFDNIKVEIENSVLETLTPQPVTNADFMKPYVTTNDDQTEASFEMPGYNVEVNVEYFAESNLFLNKRALADKANIVVKNGETAVEFDAEGKSTTIVTEDDKVTVQFAGTKEVLGMKVIEKAVAATIVADEGTTIRPISNPIVATNFHSSGWVADTQSYAEWDATAGKVTVHIAEDKVARWQGWVQVQMESAPRKGYSYQLKAKMKNLDPNSPIDGVCVKYPEGDESDTPMFQREDISLPANQEYVLETGLMAGIDAKTAIIVFDFGFAKAGDNIEIYDIEITETYTGLEVNWDAATKTGTFTMPAYDVEIAPIYAPATLVLSEETDNTATLEEWDGFEADVTLTRTLQTGGWNTLAVPFSIDAANFAALQALLAAQGGSMALKQLSSSELNDNTLTLNFADATSIEAGKPYLVKVSSNLNFATLPAMIDALGSPVNPFKDAEVSKTAVPTETDAVDFIPTLGATTIEGDDAKTVLFLAAENKLMNPTTLPADIKGFRAYFQLKGEAAGVKSFLLNLCEEEATGIQTIDNGQLTIDN